MGAKNMQNFGRFSTTSDCDREYLRNGARYRKSERHVISSDSSRVRWKRFGELWSTIYREFHVSLDPLNGLFGKTIFRPLEGASIQIFTRARDWPRLPSAHPNWDGDPPKNFNRENLAFGLKFNVLATITSGLVGVSQQNIIHTTCHEAGVITY